MIGHGGEPHIRLTPTRLHLTVIEARLSNLEPGGQLHSDVEAQDQESGSDSSLTAGDPARNDASESTQ